MPARQRPAEEIRACIEANGHEVGAGLERLQGQVREGTNWRARYAARQQQVLGAAAGAGFLLGGGLVAFTGLFRARRS